MMGVDPGDQAVCSVIHYQAESLFPAFLITLSEQELVQRPTSNQTHARKTARRTGIADGRCAFRLCG